MGVGIIAQFQMSEMIKKEQYTKADPDRVGELQNGKTVGAFSHDNGVKLVKRLPRSTSLLKVIIEKAGAEKGNQAYKKDFYIPEKLSCGGTDAVGDDEIRFSHGRNINRWFQLLDLFQKI